MTQNKPDNASLDIQSSHTLFCVILAITSGIIIGMIDLQVTEVTVTILSLLIAGLLLGLIQPKSAWRWAILISAGIPVMEIIAVNFSLQTAEPVKLDPFIILITFLFALIGTYAGVFIRKILRA